MMILDAKRTEKITLNQKQFKVYTTENEIKRIKREKRYSTWFLKVCDIIKPTDVVIEVGSYIGLQTLYLADHCQHIYAFEPFRLSFDLLKSNILSSNQTNITISKLAIGLYTSTSILQMFIPKTTNDTTFFNKASLTSTGNSEKKIQNSVITHKLDDFMHISPFPTVIFVDIDNYKDTLNILESATEMIKQFRPKFIIKNIEKFQTNRIEKELNKNDPQILHQFKYVYTLINKEDPYYILSVDNHGEL